MKGLKLDSFKAELKKVSLRYKRPIYAIRNVASKFSGKLDLIKSHFDNFSFTKHCYRLPINLLSGLTFDELCKINYSSSFVMDDSVEKLFKKNYQYEIVRKIKSSMWRWGYGRDVWNEVVDAYDCIRHFTFTNIPHFEIRLDYSTYSNERGYSKYSRTFLDGVFAFLVYYKEEHVMTIGFSIVAGKIVLLQQVQLAQRRKNRFLYKLPSNRLEFIVGLFRQNFPEHSIYLTDGKSLSERILSDYRNNLNNSLAQCEQYKKDLKKIKGKTRTPYRKWLKETTEDCEVLKNKIAHLENDGERLKSFYGNAGAYIINKGASIELNRIIYHQIMS